MPLGRGDGSTRVRIADTFSPAVAARTSKPWRLPGGGGIVPVQPVHGRSDDRDVPVPDRLGAVARLWRHARHQFRARLVLHDRRLSRVAGGAMASTLPASVLAGSA